MKKLYIINLFLFLAFNGFAQNGYFGKDLAIKFDANLMLRIWSLQTENNGLNAIKSSLYLSVPLSLKNKAISLDFQHTRFNDLQTIYEEPDKTHYIRQNSVGLSLRKFNDDWISPVGNYRMYSLLFSMNNISDDPNMSDPKHYFSAKFGYGKGIQRVLFDRVILDLGFICYVSTDLVKSIIRTEEGMYDDEYYRKKALTSLSISDIFYFKIGLGYMFKNPIKKAK